MDKELNNESMENDNMQAVDAVMVSEELVELNSFDEPKNSRSEDSSQVTPPVIDTEPNLGMNAGALCFPFIWSLANGLIDMAVLSVFFKPIMMPVLNLNGNKWSWERGNWESAEKFNKVQSGWNIAGLVFIGIVVIAIIIAVAVD